LREFTCSARDSFFGGKLIAITGFMPHLRSFRRYVSESWLRWA
jgi:hypothetical protein